MPPAGLAITVISSRPRPIRRPPRSLRKALKDLDSLLSIQQMPGGIPVGALAVGKAGAINAGLLAVAILALNDPALSKRLQAWRAKQTKAIKIAPVSEKKKK